MKNTAPFVLRPYQQKAVDAALNAFQAHNCNGLIIAPTGCGKSVIISELAYRLNEHILVFCPSKELVQQDYDKMMAYGVTDCGIYSASVGCKDIRKITFATIGSVMNHLRDFRFFRYIIIDECHLANAKAGQYKDFLAARADRQVIGLTATPYRLTSSLDFGCTLKFLTRTRPRIFDKVIYYCQIQDLLNQGYLAQLNYFDLTSIDLSRISSNSTGMDYDDQSLIREFERSGFYDRLAYTTLRVLHPKDGHPRHGILVFTRFTKEADTLTATLSGAGVAAASVSAKTPKKERQRIVNAFKTGEIKVVANVGIMTTGFDYPALDTVILARPTKSLAVYYQCVGRIIRPCAGKNGWVIDLAGNYQRFGRVEDLTVSLERPDSQLWCIASRGHQLTNKPFF